VAENPNQPSAYAVLYDIHGNLVALETVLEEAAQLGLTSFILGGDYATFGPWPRETVELLRTVEATVLIRGNVDRWLEEEPEVAASARPFVTTGVSAALQALGPELAGWLATLPAAAELDGMRICHGSPVSDIETFAPHANEQDERLLAGDADRTIVFGHSHVQFQRNGPSGTRLVNPGSVGAPLDCDPRAAWGVLADGEIHFRRTEYDTERAAARMRSLGEWAAPIVHRIEYGADP
jgi:diadenosine tetraphosphatase ApaH/serine/threonine PP2A family protein phosphatase